MKFESARNPFDQREKTERERRLIRARVIAALLSATTIPSIEACAAPLTIGKTPLADIQPDERPAERPDLPTYEAMLKQLKANLGEDLVGQALVMHEAYREHAAENHGSPEIVGFTRMDIPDEQVLQYLGLYPRSWISHVSKISLNPHFSPIGYPGLEGKPEYGHCSLSSNGEDVQIEFTDTGLKREEMPKPKDVFYLMKVMNHEMAHAASWTSNSGLDGPHALTTMYLTYLAVLDDGRPKFDYPESIMSADPSQRSAVTFARMTEFFAELISESFNVDGKDWSSWTSKFKHNLTYYHATEAAAERDAILVRDFMTWTDPGYKPWETHKLRIEITDEMADAHAFRRVLRDIETIPDTDIRQTLTWVMAAKNISQDDALYQNIRIGGDHFDSGERYKGYQDFLTDLEIDDDSLREMGYFLGIAIAARNNNLGLRTIHGTRFRTDSMANRFKNFNETWNNLSDKDKQRIKPLLLELINQSLAKSPSPETTDGNLAKRD